MDELVRWLGEQLDAEEVAAREAIEQVGDGHWQQRNTRIVTVANRDREVADYAIHECIDHIVRHDPVRVLREIDADRKLLAQYAEVAANDVDDVEYAHGWANALGLAVRLRASVYADRPGYREEWAP